MTTVEHTEIGGGPSGDDLRQIIDAARGALDLEFQRAERLDAKTRGQVTLAGSWFAVVQAVAAVALGERAATGWIGAIAGTAVVAGVALVVSIARAADVWKLRPQPAVDQATLGDMLTAAEREPDTFGRQLVQLYRNLLGHAQAANESRALALDRATKAWWFALVLGLVELAIALASRIFGA